MKWYGYAAFAALAIVGAKFARIIPKQFEAIAIATAIALTFIAIPLLMRRARRAAEMASGATALPAQVILGRTEEAFSLYLRSFDLDSLRPNDTAVRRHLFDAYGPPEETYEVAMMARLSRIAPIVAIGKPKSEASTQLGTYKYYAPDGDDWQQKVHDLIVQAETVFVRIGNLTPGLMWELQSIKDLRGYKSTAIILPIDHERRLLYAKLLELLPADTRLQFPEYEDDLRAIYIDYLGEAHVLRKRWAIIETVDNWLTENLFYLVAADVMQSKKLADSDIGYSLSGVRCWHRDGIGLTPINSFAGKVIVSAAGFHFLSSGSSLVSEILSQPSSMSSVNATESLRFGAENNLGGLLAFHSDIEELEVLGGFMRTQYIRLKYLDTSLATKYASFALDGNNRNTREGLNLVVQHYIRMRELVDA